MSSLCQNIFKVQDSTQVQAQYVDSLDIRDGLDDRKPSTDILYSRLSHQSRSQAVNYSSVWGWITEESAEMPFKDSLPELQSPCGLSDLPTHCLFLNLTPGAVIYSLSCFWSSFSPSFPDPLSRTTAEFTESQLSYSDRRSQWL